MNSVFGAPIHNAPNLAKARAVALRRMQSMCELIKPGATPAGFGATSTADQIAGRVRCSISQATRPLDNERENDASAAATEYEFAFPWGTRIDPTYRLAVPARFPKWRPLTSYTRGQIISPTNWVNGRTDVWRCASPGVSSSSEPEWEGLNLVANGTVAWKRSGVATLFEVIGVNDNETQAVEVVVRCKELS